MGFRIVLRIVELLLQSWRVEVFVSRVGGNDEHMVRGTYDNPNPNPNPNPNDKSVCYESGMVRLGNNRCTIAGVVLEAGDTNRNAASLSNGNLGVSTYCDIP